MMIWDQQVNPCYSHTVSIKLQYLVTLHLRVKIMSMMPFYVCTTPIFDILTIYYTFLIQSLTTCEQFWHFLFVYWTDDSIEADRKQMQQRPRAGIKPWTAQSNDTWLTAHVFTDSPCKAVNNK